MAIKHYKPTTPGRRKASGISFHELTKKKPEKSLMIIKKSSAGRNVRGKITVRHRGGGHKKFYRIVDFKREKFDKPAKVLSIEYDPNRTAFIALIKYEDGEKKYILAPEGLKKDDVITSSLRKIGIERGNRLPLENIPSGISVYNIELERGGGGKIVRAAGATAQTMGVEGNYAQLKMPSGEVRLVLKNCLASVGQVSNIDNFNIRLGKAGRKRWRGIRPQVRGKAMNPVDHPHGGGEGGSPIGLKHPKTPWGKPALGVKTRKKNKKSNRLIIERRK